MKIEDVEIGMRVVTGPLWKFDEDAGIVESLRDDTSVWVVWDSDGCNHWTDVEDIEPEVKTEQELSLKNVKINVQKYADDNGLTLAQAHKEVQEWLFGHGYTWGTSAGTNYKDIPSPYLFTDSLGNKELSHCVGNAHFEKHENKEITLSRTVNIVPAFVEEPVQDVVEYVELGGRKFLRKDLEEALSKIKAVEEGK